MQFRQMRHFIVVAEELHMHRAAERLNMAQPTLNQQIKATEERLGVTLFSRANRRLTLTPAGEAFLVKARLAISLTEQAVLDARQTARGEQGVLNLGCVSSAMFDGRLPAALRQMHSRWPAITMSLMTGNVQTLYAAVQSNQLDVAIIRAPLPSLPDDLQSRPFASEKTVLALYRQHPLAGSAALTLSSVKDEKWISCATRREWGWSSTSMTPAAGRAFSRTWCKTRPTCPRSSARFRQGLVWRCFPRRQRR